MTALLLNLHIGERGAAGGSSAPNHHVHHRPEEPFGRIFLQFSAELRYLGLVIMARASL